LLGFVHYVFYPKIKKGIEDRNAIFENYKNHIDSAKSQIKSKKDDYENNLRAHQKNIKKQIQNKISELEERKIFHFHTLDKDLLEEIRMETGKLKAHSVSHDFLNASLSKILKKLNLEKN
jgi:hypothetical protein